MRRRRVRIRVFLVLLAVMVIAGLVLGYAQWQASQEVDTLDASLYVQDYVRAHYPDPQRSDTEGLGLGEPEITRCFLVVQTKPDRYLCDVLLASGRRLGFQLETTSGGIFHLDHFKLVKVRRISRRLRPDQRSLTVEGEASGRIYIGICGSTGMLESKPRYWSTGCTGSSFNVHAIKWRSWGRRTAFIRGTAWLAVTPDGPRYKSPAELHLY